jgi:hypothetical protein
MIYYPPRIQRKRQDERGIFPHFRKNQVMMRGFGSAFLAISELKFKKEGL